MGRPLRFINPNYPLWYRSFKMRADAKARAVRRRLESLPAASLNITNMSGFRGKASAVYNTEGSGLWVFGMENVAKLLASKRYFVHRIFLEIGKCTKEEKHLLCQINELARQYDVDVAVVANKSLVECSGSNGHEGVYARVMPSTDEESSAMQRGAIETGIEADGRSVERAEKLESTYLSNKST